MRDLVVKIGLRGDIYVDGKAVTSAELAEGIRQLNLDDGAVTYYRESPETEGSTAATDAFRLLLAQRPKKIRMGNDAPSEWGTLRWLELQEAPAVWRIFLAQGQKYLISLPRTPGQPAGPVFAGGPLKSEAELHWLRQFDLIIRCDRVLETPPQHPELAFAEAGLREASLHLRVSYLPDRRWASRFLPSEVPANIAVFQADAMRIARRMTAGGGRKMSADEASRLFEP